MTQTIVYYFIALNIVTFLVYDIDKWKAKKAKMLTGQVIKVSGGHALSLH